MAALKLTQRGALSLAELLGKDLEVGGRPKKAGLLCLPALQKHTAGGDQGPTPPKRGWADRIRVPCLLLRDERDLVGEKAKLTIDAMPSSSVSGIQGDPPKANSEQGTLDWF